MYKHNLTPVLNLQRPDKNGLYPLRIRSTIKGVPDYHPTGIMLLKENWDAENLKVINLKNRNLQNLSINAELNRLEKLFLEQNLEGNNIVKIKTKDAKDFYAFATAELLRIEQSKSAATYTQRKSFISILKKFKSKITFAEITPDFMQKLETYLRGRNNCENTVHKNTQQLTQFIIAAVKNNVIKRNPIEKFEHVKYTKPARSFLSQDSLCLVEGFANNFAHPAYLRNTAIRFLFSCFCGLRYSDSKNFSAKYIIDGQIILRTIKTDTDVSIFIHEKLNDIIERLIYPMPNYHIYRRELIEISDLLKLDKPLKSHKARHTFAVHSINMGVSMEALSKTLGHTDIKTTQIYGQITNTKANAEIKKAWNKKNPA